MLFSGSWFAAALDAVVVICSEAVPVLLNVPKTQAAPLGRPLQANATELLVKPETVSVVVAEPPGAEIVTAGEAAVIATEPEAAATVRVVAVEVTVAKFESPEYIAVMAYDPAVAKV